MAVTDEIRERLESAFSPTELTVEDESEQHRGHAGFREGGESHFRVTIRAPAFGPMTQDRTAQGGPHGIGTRPCRPDPRTCPEDRRLRGYSAAVVVVTSCGFVSVMRRAPDRTRSTTSGCETRRARTSFIASVTLAGRRGRRMVTGWTGAAA